MKINSVGKVHFEVHLRCSLALVFFIFFFYGSRCIVKHFNARLRPSVSKLRQHLFQHAVKVGEVMTLFRSNLFLDYIQTQERKWSVVYVAVSLWCVSRETMWKGEVR